MNLIVKSSEKSPCLMLKSLSFSNMKSQFLSHRIHGAGIYANIYHQYTPVMLAYIPCIHGSVMGVAEKIRVFFASPGPVAPSGHGNAAMLGTGC